ncbi:MAG: site-specific integrase [Leptolyngbyaceae cyanobacterium SL_7_1]|nr:site-specific integrase [Leptolyngbyaceae cyanobacterium SL_7_1]
MDVTGKIAQANGRLRSNRVGVRIEQLGEKLYLQATFPPKPGNSKTKPYQQRIALGVGAHPKGVSLAELEARKVGALLDCNQFDWAPYLTSREQTPQTAGEWIERFEHEHRGKVSDTTWQTEYQRVFSRLPSNQPLTPELLTQTIAQSQNNSRQRKRFCISLGKLAAFAGLEVDFKPLQGSYSYTEVDPRSLPADDLITEWFHNIPNPRWQWVYGMLAAFGLRNHEVFFLDLDDLTNGGYMVRVSKGKTGSHLVWACYPEWIEQFDLRTPKLPPVTGKAHADYGNRVTHQFERYQVPFSAYDLRHRWAVRTLEFGLPTSLAAQQMGHSVAVHERIYHHWITADTHQKAFNALMLRSDRPKPPSFIP